MKKNHLILTGIALLTAVLVAGGCNRKSKPNASKDAGAGGEIIADDTTKVDIYLKAVEIDGSMHLEMYEERKGCPVIDGLLTVAYGGYTIKWYKKDNSIFQVSDIRPTNDPGGIFDGLREDKAKSLWTLEIPENPNPDTIKYLIDFIVRDNMDSTYTVDPYLRIPPAPSSN